MGGLVRIVHELNVKQRRGIFRVPENVQADTGLLNWTERLQQFPLPLVTAEETYFRGGIQRKLRTSRRIVTDKLSRYGLLRPRESDDFAYGGPTTRAPVSTLSLAQTISWAFQQPIQEILIPERAFSRKEFLQQPPQERVITLFNAYTGCRWMERITKEQKLFSDLVKPQVKPWQRISRYDLTRWFGGGMANGAVRKLSEKGMVIPKGNSWTSKSLHNIVDREALAQLIALFHGVSLDDVLVSDNDAYLNELAQTFFYNRLIPFMSAHNINVGDTYSIPEAAALLGIPYDRVRRAAQCGTIRNTTFAGGNTKLHGVDMAIFALKNTAKQVFTKRDVETLFGADRIDFRYLGMQSTIYGTRSRHHYVFPIYDLIAQKAVKLFGNDHLKRAQ